jgi:hypothetical protein
MLKKFFGILLSTASKHIFFRRCQTRKCIRYIFVVVSVFTTVFILGACSNGNHDQIKIRDIGIVGCNSIEDYQDLLYNQFDSIISNEDEGVIDLTLINNLSNYEK